MYVGCATFNVCMYIEVKSLGKLPKFDLLATLPFRNISPELTPFMHALARAISKAAYDRRLLLCIWRHHVAYLDECNPQ